MEIIYPVEVYKKYFQQINKLKKMALKICGEVAMTAINQSTEIYTYGNNESMPDYTVEIHVELSQDEIRSAFSEKGLTPFSPPIASEAHVLKKMLNEQYAQFDNPTKKIEGCIRKNWPTKHKEWLTLSIIGKNIEKFQPLNIKGVEVVFKENPS